MRTRVTTICYLLAAVCLPAFAQGTAFTYQGRLNAGGSPAIGSYDIAFTLFATNTSGVAIAGPVTNAAVGVINGLFTTMVDFGSVFAGGTNWLEIYVSTNGANSFFTLAPRQQLTPVPYALFAVNASNLAGSVLATQLSGKIPATNISGTISFSQLPSTIVTNGAGGVNISGTFSGNGAGLANVFPVQTVYYTTNGTYSFIVPTNVSQMVVKLWGAGGQSILGNTGGGGAFVQITLAVTPGDTYVIVVGQGGAAGGGAGANDGSGGPGLSGGGAGGQASSLFKFTGSHYIMKAVAGAGGGGSGFAGGYGGGGGATSPRIVFDYSPNALTIGETNLNLMGGDGDTGHGNPAGKGGGGGGGYEGGEGANDIGSFASIGGNSYGDIIVGGNPSLIQIGIPGNISDPNYFSPAGSAGSDGMAMVIFKSFIEANVTVMTNFTTVGPLAPAAFSFTSHGGTLLITTDGAGSTSSSPIAIGMTVSLDGTAITTNRVFINVNSHAAFVSKTLVRRGVAAGNHTITLTSWNGTTTDLNDNFSVTVQELPY